MSNPIPRVRLPKFLAFALRFALWCQRLKIEPADGAELVALARRAFAAGERACNGPGRRDAEERAAVAVESKAQALGFGVQWPGLWPNLTRGGECIEIPTD